LYFERIGRFLNGGPGREGIEENIPADKMVQRTGGREGGRGGI
jgi:hypothetical protein